MRAFFEQHRFLLAFAALSSVMGISVGIAKLATSLYALHLGAEEAVLGVVAASQSVGVLAMSLPLGFLIDRHGPARLFAIGTVLASALYCVLPLVPSPLFLVACTAVIGCFMPFRFIALNTVFLEQLTSLGEAKAGWYRATHMGGTFLIGPALAAGCVETLGFRGTYWLISGLFVLTILMGPSVFGRVARAPSALRAITWSEVNAQLELMVRDRDLRSACSAEFAAQAITMFYGFFIVVIAVKDLGLRPGQASGLVAAQGLSYVIALFTFGAPARALGQLPAYFAGAGTISVALLLLGSAGSASALLCGGGLLGLGTGLLQIVNLMRFARIGARLGRGKIAGLNALAGPAGALFGNLGGGLLGQTIGLQAVFLAFLPLLALLCWQLFVNQRALLAER